MSKKKSCLVLTKNSVQEWEAIRLAVRKFVSAVVSTHGPSGKVAYLGSSFKPRLTKDGVTVANEYPLDAGLTSTAVKVLLQAPQKTVENAGDGTTTSTCLVGGIFDEGAKLCIAGFDMLAVRRGVQKATDAAIAFITNNAVKMNSHTTTPEDRKAFLLKVATIASNNDKQIAEIVVHGLESVGPDGVLLVEESKGIQNSYDVVKGLQIDKGYDSPHFITDPKKSVCAYDNPYILICEKKISSVQDLLPIIESICAKQGQPLVIFAEEFDTEVINFLALNRLRLGIKICAVKNPGFGERRKALMNDMSMVLGGEIISDSLSTRLQDLNINHLGRCERIIITDHDTTFMANNIPNSEAFKDYCDMLRDRIADSTSEYDRDQLKKRLAQLVSGIGKISVVGSEVKDRTEDAVHATKHAMNGGVVVGGGVIYLRAANFLENLKSEAASIEERAGIELTQRALKYPFKSVLNNAGMIENCPIIANRILEQAYIHYGFDIATGSYGDMMDKGIVDSVKVCTEALKWASEFAMNLLTVGCIFYEEELKDDVEATPSAMNHGMDGMAQDMY